MPFTPAHVALVLPLVRKDPRYVSATGLIIGSMVPDFEYFFRMSPDANYGHTLPGLFFFDLPVAVLLAIVFHQVVKQKLISHLPVFFQTRLQQLRQLDFMTHLKTHFIAFAVSALVGAASHMLWDEFTHGDGYFATRIPFYRRHYIPFEGVRYPLWYALQNICSWVGLAVVAVYIWCLKPRPGAVHKPSLWYYWCFVLAATLLTVGLRFQFDLSEVKIGVLIVTSISGLCIAVVLAGLMPFRTASGYN